MNLFINNKIHLFTCIVVLATVPLKASWDIVNRERRQAINNFEIYIHRMVIRQHFANIKMINYMIKTRFVVPIGLKARADREPVQIQPLIIGFEAILEMKLKLF